MGYLTGGPQRYTGRPMDVAHKHLGISRAEWAEFTAVTDRVLKECGVPRGAARELLGIIAGFEDSCTLRDGEAPWPEPVNKAHPSAMGTPFHRLGGVYPLSRFVSALIDSGIPLAELDSAFVTKSCHRFNKMLAKYWKVPHVARELTHLFDGKQIRDEKFRRIKPVYESARKSGASSCSSAHVQF